MHRLFVALFVVVAILNVGCTTTSQEAPIRLTYGLTLTVSGVDPHIHRSTELGIVLRQVYDTLVYRDPETGLFVPGLAIRWRTSNDGLTTTFTLREGVAFHDGTPFNASAVVANIERIANPATASQRARALLGPLASVTAVDDTTLVFEYQQPFAPLLDSLSQVYLAIASPTALAEFVDDPLRYQFHQVGTGPFEFVEYVPEDRIVIRRNDSYAWGPSFYDELADNAVEEVEFRFFRDEATRLAALENGDAHVMGELSPIDARAASNNPRITLIPVPIAGQPVQFYFNTTQPPLDQRAVRQALLYGLNRNALVDAVYGGFSPVAWGPISSETDFYNRGVENVYAYDLEQANTLLGDAGYSDTDDDGILDRDGEALAITVLQPPWGRLSQVTQLMADQWAVLGIDVNIVPIPTYPALLEAIRTEPYHLVSFDQPGLDPYILNQAYLSTGDSNYANVDIPELDTLLLAAAQQTDVNQRRLDYGRIQALIMEQALTIPLSEYVNLNAAVASVDNLIFDPYGWFPLLYNVTLDQ